MKGENAVISALRALASHPAARNLADDAAVLEVNGEALVLTHDMLVEGVHFLPNADPADIAWKLVATNMSDLAAKGAQPMAVLLGFMLGKNDERFIVGLGEALEHYNVSLLGGDTTSGGPPRSFGLTAIGRATHTPVPTRGGARPGDGLFVTGRIGAAMIGFEAVRKGTSEDSLSYRRPMARLAEGQLLAPVVTAMMDISDGLLLDAFRLAEASDVTIALDSQAVPLDAPENRRQDAIHWGDDYELLFTAPADIELPVPATKVGTVQAKGEAPMLYDGQPINDSEGLGYLH